MRMTQSKAIYVTKHKIRNDQNFRDSNYDTSNFGCQYDSKKDNLICTCRNPKKDMRYFSGTPKQIYAYHGSRSYTDVGVGSVKALQRRKVKRVYLPETDDRGVGSSDLSAFITRKIKKPKSSFYDHKRTSSKCVGGFLENNSFISQKLSPIVVHTKSGSTSPKTSMNQNSIEIGSNTIEKNVVTTGTQFEIEKKETKEMIVENAPNIKVIEPTKKPVVKVSKQTQKLKNSDEIQGKKISVIERKPKDVDKVYSSDSLVQHVHNLENPIDEKQSRTSIDPMENKLEREYRRMFSTKDRDSKSSVDKPIPEMKSASILRRRFEALRRGLKNDGKKNNLLSSQDSVPSRKDASVTSDPPSLEGRSFTDTKKYSPIQANVEDQNKRNYNTERGSAQWPQSDIDSDCQGVKGMFNLWGKKFKFEEDIEKKKTTPLPAPAIDINTKPHKQSKLKKEADPKKSGRKFFFFKKKSKDTKLDKPKENEKEIYNPSGVTAGRCEIRDGLVMKMGNVTPKEKISRISEEGDDIQRKTWFKNFVASAISSARSVNVRWKNSMYATSSSTVFELLDTMYKNNGVVIKSRSEITSDESSSYRSYTKNKVNFDQNIEAWMVPMTIPDRPREIPVRIQSNRYIKDGDMDMTISDQTWFIEKSKAFPNKIEVVLLSRNFNRVTNKVSSEYLRIDIPKDFFDISSSDDSKQNHTSDEEVYNIVEYESDLIEKKDLDKGDHASEIKVIVNVQDSRNMEAKILETVIKRPPMHRDVVIQGSNVNIPKRCDVISVGIITQRDLRDIRKPILKIQDDLSDEDLEERVQTNQKKCDFAESYLQEYYRHWAPLGLDLFSWCVSDSHLHSCSGTSQKKSLISFHNQGDGSKSCPNICEDYQASIMISSCNTSSCSQCCEDPKERVQKPDETFLSKFFKGCKKPSKANTDTDIAGKRVLPKDSLEVFKRRKIYAMSLKSKWACNEDEPVSVPSNESKGAQDTFIDCPKLDKSICKPPRSRNAKKTCKKHVSMHGCDTMNEKLADQLSDIKLDGILAFKGVSGCEACKKKNKCAKHAVVKAKPICEIPREPPCKVSCEKMKKPPCDKPAPPTCDASPVQSPNRSPNMSLVSDAVKRIPHSNGSAIKPSCEKCKPRPRCPTSPPLEASPPRCPASPPQCPASPPPKQARARRKAKPDIRCGSPRCSPPLSRNGSPKSSHNCLSPAQSPIPKQKKCPKCQQPQPCTKFPKCQLSSESLQNSPDCSPKQSFPKQKKSPKCHQPQPCPKCHLSSESLQNSLDCSPKQSPKASPPCSPKASKKSPPLSPGLTLKGCPGSPPPKKKKPPKTTPCRLPPCNLIKKSGCPADSPPKSPCDSEQFPWPMNSQVSNPSSPTCSDTNLKKTKDKCKTKCSMLSKTSNQSLAPKECRPDCARRKKKPVCPEPEPQICPENKQQSCPTKQQQPCPAKSPPAAKRSLILMGKEKISGLFLKMKPMKKKTCSKECLAWENQNEKGVLRLNSREKITISMKKDTPSTETIRDCMNVKVRDDDGNTLFERKDYTCGHAGRRPSVLEDMYKGSKINRVSTPVMIVANDLNENCPQQPEENYYKSEASLANLIEIQFKLQITQGDKTTEISIANEEDKQDKGNEIRNTVSEVYVVENEVKEQEKGIEEGPKNDINIKIIVKNYKPKANRAKHVRNDCQDNAFSNKISDKFHTVSTGYSDIMIDPEEDNVFSVHRATVDLDSVDNKSKTLSEISNDMISEELTEPINFMVSSHSTENLATYATEDENNEISTLIKKDTLSDKYDHTNSETKDVESDQDVLLDLNTSNECFEPKYNAKEEKKELMKKAFEKAYTKPKNKENNRELLNTLKIILTDSSDNDEMNAASELAKDVTYASLKPDFFRNTDSMNNYYKMESYLTVEGSKITSDCLFPTENNSYTIGTSKSIKQQGCMCKHVAEKLNCDLKVGCCCRQTKIDEVTSCDLRNEQDIVLFNYRTDYVDVFTQNSKHLSNKSNSMNLSIHSTENSVQIETDKISIKENSMNTEVSKRATKSFVPRCYIKNCDMKKLNRTTVLRISDDDKIVLLNDEATVKKNKSKSLNLFKAHDVLQCYETKKAVLAIYAEKTISENGEHFVAKLPKFVYEKESEITRNYEQIATNSYRSVCKRNVFRMSVG